VPYNVLSHTADTGIEARADTYPELVAELATGMFDLMGDAPLGVVGEPVEIGVEASSHEDLVIDALSELLYRSEVDDLFLFDFGVSARGDRIHVRARGVPIAQVEPTGPPIKAVTYHDVAVHPMGDGWYGRVYFDV
jgi:SHS2 domain-containing protein